MEDADQMGEILKRLKREFTIDSKVGRRDAFETLIAVILSQNTTSKASSEAFERLRQEFEIKPHILADADPEDIKPLIRSAGLSVIKSRRIIEVSRTVLRRFGKNFEKVIGLPYAEARAALMDIEGIGPKTADVVLAFAGERETLPIDTNIFRVANRLGIVEGRDYERTKAALERVVPPEERIETHILLIILGKDFCRAKNPKCDICPISDLCAKRI